MKIVLLRMLVAPAVHAEQSSPAGWIEQGTATADAKVRNARIMIRPVESQSDPRGDERSTGTGYEVRSVGLNEYVTLLVEWHITSICTRRSGCGSCRVLKGNAWRRCRENRQARRRMEHPPGAALIIYVVFQARGVPPTGAKREAARPRARTLTSSRPRSWSPSFAGPTPCPGSSCSGRS